MTLQCHAAKWRHNVALGGGITVQPAHKSIFSKFTVQQVRRVELGENAPYFGNFVSQSTPSPVLNS